MKVYCLIRESDNKSMLLEQNGDGWWGERQIESKTRSRSSTSRWDGMNRRIKEEIGTERRIQQSEHTPDKRGNSNVYTIRIQYVCVQGPKLTGKTVVLKNASYATFPFLYFLCLCARDEHLTFQTHTPSRCWGNRSILSAQQSITAAWIRSWVNSWWLRIFTQ